MNSTENLDIRSKLLQKSCVDLYLWRLIIRLYYALIPKHKQRVLQRKETTL